MLEQDVITPTVKPQAKQDIIQAVTTRKQQIKSQMHHYKMKKM